MRPLLFFTLFISLVSCSLKRRQNDLEEQENDLRGAQLQREYVTALASWGPVLIKSGEIRPIKFSRKGLSYLRKAYDEIVFSNQGLLDRKLRPKFWFFKDERPLYFSLPDGSFYFSSGLIVNYLSTDLLFRALLTRMVIRAHKLLYRKVFLVPTESLSLSEVLRHLQISDKTRGVINQHAFIALERSGRDPFVLLNLIQGQSKNFLDFILLYGGARALTNEEFRLKKFIVRSGPRESEGLAPASKASLYYRLRAEIRRGHNGPI